MERWQWIAAITALAACSGGGTTKEDGPTDTADTDTDTDADADTDADTDTDTDTEDTSASLSGTVTDASGEPIAAAALRFCRGVVCRNGTTGADGSYAFDGVAVDWFSFEVVGGPGQVTAFVPLVFASQEARALDIAVQDAIETPLPRAAAVLDVAPGLRIEAGVDDLETPAFEDPATALLAARVDPTQWVPTDEITGTVHGQWALGPFDYAAVDAAGLPATFENPAGLAEGTTLRVYVGTYATSRWEDAGTVTTSASGWTTSVGLPLLSTVLLVEE